MKEKFCDSCGGSDIGKDGKNASIPFYVHEWEMARSERHIRRLWIALIVAIALVFASNLAWLIYDSQFDKLSYSQDGEGINNINLGEQGDLNNGAENTSSVVEK